MTAKVKICGVNSLEAVKACLLNKADFIGFVFALSSPRFITYEQAAKLASIVDKEAFKTGLFVNPSLDEIKKALSLVELDYIQLHGRETKEDIINIKSSFNKPIIKAVAVSNLEDVLQAKIFYDIADIILFDAKAPLGADNNGGNGRAFDWGLLKDIPDNINWCLAGGLNPYNVGNAIKQTGAKMVDVSSGVEKAKAVKDDDLIKQFIKEAKNAV